jgi:hypothetical protein
VSGIHRVLLGRQAPRGVVPPPLKESWAESAFDEIDAGFFSADTFHSEEAIARAEWYMGRWAREIVAIRETLKELTGEKHD